MTTPTSARKIIPLKKEYEEKRKDRSSLGVLGTILSVLSLFALPYFLAPLGILFGYFGYSKGDHTLGFWAIGLGIVGILGTIIVASVLT